MADVSQIDFEAVEASANGFKQVGETLSLVNTALEAAMMILRTTAFMGLVGGAAVERYLANIQPKVEQLSTKCKETAEELKQAMEIIRTTDEGNTQPF